MRMGLLAAIVFLLGACAGADQSRPQSGAGNFPSMAEKAASLTDDEAKEYATELAKERVVAICSESRGLAAQMTCARDEIFRGFDTTGEAKRHCDGDAPVRELLQCAVLGSFGYEIALAADLPQATDYNWQDPKAALKETIASLANVQTDICMEGPLAQIDQCMLRGFGAAFSLTEQQVAACTDTSDSGDSIDCLVRVFMVQRFESAVARMGPGEGQRA
jgi:hypothetical protein